MDDTGLTLAAVSQHGWRLVLLRPRDKRPAGSTWTITSDIAELARHLSQEGNVGLVCGPESGIAVLDFDDTEAAKEMVAELGPLSATVLTGRARGHAYVRWEKGLPAKIRWRGKVVGECQRGDGRLQHVVCPPSIHPDTGRAYKWLTDPRLAPQPLPLAWRAHLNSPTAGDGVVFGSGVVGAGTTTVRGQSGVSEEDLATLRGLSVPEYVVVGDVRGTENAARSWDGPSAEVLIERARSQPGARGRAGGSTKFQCAGCRAEGRDRHMDNARVFPTGRWGCAVNREHRKAIAQQLGLAVARLPEQPGDRITLPYTQADAEWDQQHRIPLMPDDPEWERYGKKKQRRD